MHSTPSLTPRTPSAVWFAVALALPMSSFLACGSCAAPAGVEGEGEGAVAEGEGEGANGGEGEGAVNPLAPVVTIDEPSDGTFLKAGATTRFRCHAVDHNGTAIANGSITWTASVDGALGIGQQVQNAVTTLGDQTITCTATDTVGQEGSASIVVHIVDNLPPVITIHSPHDGDFFTPNDTVTFRGDATDPESGAIGNAGLHWTSDGSAIGSGALVQTSLGLGDHVIALSATDPDGNSNSASVTIHVVDNVPPQCTITNPSDGGAVVAGATTTFSVTCDNPDGAPVDNATIHWTSDVDGNIGTGAIVQNALTTRGTQTITVCATDPADATLTTCVSITVTVGDNASPTVTIQSPDNNATIRACRDVPLHCNATDPDGTIADVTWTDSNGDAIDAGAFVAFTPATAGAHTLTCTATDNLGATSSASVDITIDSPAANIQQPQDGDGFAHGDTVQLRGSGCDTVLGDLPDGDLSWSVDGGASIATGSQATLDTNPLSIGQHTITLTVTNGTTTSTDSVQIHVQN